MKCRCVGILCESDYISNAKKITIQFGNRKARKQASGAAAAGLAVWADRDWTHALKKACEKDGVFRDPIYNLKWDYGTDGIWDPHKMASKING